MIFARDKSQMCNNLMQFAHVYAWAREHNRSVMSMRFSYKYPYFKISHSKYVSFAMYLFAKCMSGVKLLPTASFKYEGCDYEALEQKMLRHKNIVVSGWFVRYYDLFLKYRNEICNLFTIDENITTPVKTQMEVCEVGDDMLRLGVHIRRGDYTRWKDGIYCYSDERYAEYIKAFADLFPRKEIHVYLSTNDQEVTEEKFADLAGGQNLHFHNLHGTAAGDLYMLSECDYIIGPPSTFSLVAAMYRDIPLCRMDMAKPETLTMEDFRLFEYWFRRII